MGFAVSHLGLNWLDLYCGSGHGHWRFKTACRRLEHCDLRYIHRLNNCLPNQFIDDTCGLNSQPPQPPQPVEP